MYREDTLMKKLSIEDQDQVGTGVGLSVSSMGVLSYQRAFRQVISNSSSNIFSVTFPVMMVIINVDRGTVKSVVWDDTCEWCDGTQCRPNTYNYSPDSVISREGMNCYVEDDSCIVWSKEYSNAINIETQRETEIQLATNTENTPNGTTVPSPAPTHTPVSVMPTPHPTARPTMNPTPFNAFSITEKLCELKVHIVWTGTDSKGNNFRSVAKRFSRVGGWQLRDGYIAPLQREHVANREQGSQ